MGFSSNIVRGAVVVWNLVVNVPGVDRFFATGIVLVGGSRGCGDEMFCSMTEKHLSFAGVYCFAFDLNHILQIFASVIIQFRDRQEFHDFVGSILICVEVD